MDLYSIFLIICFIRFIVTKEIYCDTEKYENSDQRFNYSNLSMIRQIYKEHNYYSLFEIVDTQIDSIPENAFTNMCFGQIRLSNNQIKYISNSSFIKMDYLTRLELNQNKLESIDGLISSLDVTSLAILDVSANRIRRIEAKFPPNLKSLTLLFLNNNEIEFISDFTFENLVNLGTLYLDNNKLKKISQFTLAKLVKLSALYFSGNLLEMIEDGAFNTLGNLATLTLSNNLLVDPKAAVFGNLTKVTSLKLDSNKIRGFREETFSNCKLLSSLDLSKNILNESFLFSGLQNINWFTLEFNKIEILKQDTFLKISKSPSFLSLRQSKIERIETGAFQNLNQLAVLDLSYNHLTILENGVFTGLFNLATLLLGYNVIATIEPLVFRPLKNLFRIDIGNNLLKTLPADLFLNLNSLETIMFNFNQIKSIKTGFLRDLPSLNSLSLDGNIIEYIEPNSFQNLTLISEIGISYNKLEIINDFYFSDLLSLKILDLSNNRINSIKANAFKDFNSIQNPLILGSKDKKIDLRGNFLISIEELSFNDCNSPYVDLSENQIDSFDPKIFLGSAIDRLSLARNILVGLEKGSLVYLDKTIEIDFNSNRIKQISGGLFGENEEKAKIERLYLNRNFLSDLKFLNRNKFTFLTDLDISYNLIECLFISNFNNLENLNSLNVGYNRLRFIDDNFFTSLSLTNFNFTSLSQTFTNLNLDNAIVIDFGLNNLSDLEVFSYSDRLEALYLRNVNLVNFKMLNFSLMSNLKILDLSENYDDGYFTLNGLTHLEYLNLSKMEIESIKRFKFSQFDYLKYLNLSYNRISSIEINTFYPIIVSLDLSHNLITFIDENTFSSLSLLEYINLENNKIKIFPYSFFQNCHTFIIKQNYILEGFQDYSSQFLFKNYVDEFDISENSIESLKLSAIFDNKASPFFINARENKLTTLRGDMFINVVTIKILNFESNQISLIDSSVFWVLDQLEYLNLGNNSITYLDERTFSMTFHLKTLNLSFNQIESIQSSLFSNLYNLEILDLSGNRLKTIEENSFRSQSLLHDLFIKDNLIDFQISENSFVGLTSIQNIFVSYEFLNVDTNKRSLLASIVPKAEKTVNDVTFFRSINIIYEYDEMSPKINCTLVLDFLARNIQVNLKTDFDFLVFLSFCRNLDLFYLV